MERRLAELRTVESDGSIRLRGGEALGSDQDVDRIGAAVPEVEADAGVGKLCDGGRDRAGGQIPAYRKDDGVPGTAEAAIEDEFVAIEPVAGWSGVGFGYAQAE